MSAPLATRFRQKQSVYPHDIFVGNILIEYNNKVISSNDYVVNTILTTDYYETKIDCWDQLNPGPPYTSGGLFLLKKFETDQWVPKSKVHWKKGSAVTYTYEGSFLPAYKPSGYLPLRPDDYGDVSGYGAMAWNRFRPTKPRAQTSVSVAELRELPRMLKSTCKDFWLSEKASKASGQSANAWLNYNFGWLPFLNDLRDFYKLTRDLDVRIKQLRHNNNRWIRRGGTISEKSETSIVHEGTSSGLYPPPTNFGSGGIDKYVLTESQKVWFSALFRYYIPPMPDFLWKGRAVSILYGAANLPSLIWELTPWSWLLDWCSNAGDLIEMIGSVAFEGLVAKNAFIMGTTVDEVTFDGTRIPGTSDETASGTWFARNTWKQRVPGSHFGFSLTPEEFSARQWSILGALGLSRLH